jgi:hypothetical protein
MQTQKQDKQRKMILVATQTAVSTGTFIVSTIQLSFIPKYVSFKQYNITTGIAGIIPIAVYCNELADDPLFIANGVQLYNVYELTNIKHRLRSSNIFPGILTFRFIDLEENGISTDIDEFSILLEFSE